MKYNKSDFWGEYLRLRHMPTTAKEAYNKIVCLYEADKRWNPNHERDGFIGHPDSKRNTRLIKMFWAFRKMEKV